jgi:hypothetical protein
MRRLPTDLMDAFEQTNASARRGQAVAGEPSLELAQGAVTVAEKQEVVGVGDGCEIRFPAPERR